MLQLFVIFVQNVAKTYFYIYKYVCVYIYRYVCAYIDDTCAKLVATGV